MMKSCSMTNAVFFACRMNLQPNVSTHGGYIIGTPVPLDDLARDDTLLGVKEARNLSGKILTSRRFVHSRARFVD